MIERSFNTGMLNLNYVEGQPSGMPLLLLHGIAVRWQALYALIPELESRWHLYAPDLRGHGRSDWARSYRVQDYTSDIASFIKNCIKKQTVILGHSFGGIIALMVAAHYPELVRAIMHLSILH